jgi:4,5-DOPA dioxygenase extradiol
MTLPTYFISHGAPDIVLRNTPAAQFLHTLPTLWAQSNPPITAILVISAHWMTDEPMVSAAPHPETIHDFGGFAKELYAMRYPAQGNASLAAQIAQQLAPVFPLASLDASRGLDHGAWIPLLLAAPEATIPVLQLSIQPHRDARHHYEVGMRLRELRDQGVLILASGNATHNLRAVFGQRYTDTPEQVHRFNDWLFEAMQARDDAALLQWERAPDAMWNHPTNDHILPLFVALGATQGAASASRIHHSVDYGVLSMDAYRMQSTSS